MSARTHQIQISKTVQLIDLNNNENKCITSFQIKPSDIAVPYDVAVVSQSMIDSAEGWEGSSTFKRFSGSVTNTVEIDDDAPQGYYLAFKAAPGSSEEPLALDIAITSTPLQAPAQEPAVIQPAILENFEDEIVKEPWYKTTWGMIIIAAVLGAVAYFGYKYWMSRKTDKDVRFKPLVQEKTIPASTSTPAPISRPITPRPFMFSPPQEESNVKSEYKTHKYRSRERVKPDFSPSRISKSLTRERPSFRTESSIATSSPSKPIDPPSIPSPVPPPVVETPSIPHVESVPTPSAPVTSEPVNRITSKLFEKLRGGFTAQ